MTRIPCYPLQVHKPVRWSRLIWLAIAGLFLSTLAARELSLQPDGRTHLSFFDVGQGDSELIVSPSGRQILIDGGPDLTTLEALGTHMPFLDRSIDLLVLTHPHLDHLASFPEILKRYHVQQVMLSGVLYDSARYSALLEQVRLQHIAVLATEPGRTIDMGDGLTLAMLWPPPEAFGSTHSNVHDTSIVFQAAYHGHTALFTGDLEEKYEKEILREGLAVRSDILKIGHHGSRTSTSTGFLLAVAPQLAVISVGTGNTYGLPHPSILARLAHFHIPYKRTDRDGTVEIVWE